MHRVNNAFLPSVLGWEKIIPDPNPHLYDIQYALPFFQLYQFCTLPLPFSFKNAKPDWFSGSVGSLLLEGSMRSILRYGNSKMLQTYWLKLVVGRTLLCCQPAGIKDSLAQWRGTIKNSATILKLSIHLCCDPESSRKCLVLLAVISHLSILHHSAHPYRFSRKLLWN